MTIILNHGTICIHHPRVPRKENRKPVAEDALLDMVTCGSYQMLFTAELKDRVTSTLEPETLELTDMSPTVPS